MAMIPFGDLIKMAGTSDPDQNSGPSIPYTIHRFSMTGSRDSQADDPPILNNWICRSQ
jgi:hypothetical protein